MNSLNISPKIPIVVVTFYADNTGFTRVVFNIFKPLTDLYDIYFIGIGYQDEPRDLNGMTLLPCNLDGGDVFGVFQAVELIKELNAPLVFFLNDIWLLSNYIQPLSLCNNVKIIMYCPLDGKITDPNMLLPFKNVDRFVMYTEFASNELQDAIIQLNEEFVFPSCDVIPHGVDCDMFYPISSSSKRDKSSVKMARKKLLIEHSDDMFIVLNANRPTPRKCIELTIAGFSLFSRNKGDDVMLYLHHAVSSDDEVEEILRLAKKYYVEERLILTQHVEDIEYLSNEHLNLIYNACDVGLNSSMGEGWGLISFEHGATGAAQIVPKHSACFELWQENAILLETKPIQSKHSLLEMAVTSDESIAEALEYLYRDYKHRVKLGEMAQQHTLNQEFQWDVIANKWNKIFQETLFN